MKARKIQIAAAITFSLLMMESPSRGQEPEYGVDSIGSQTIGLINPYSRPINVVIGGTQYTSENNGMMEYECHDPCYVSFNPKLGSYKVEVGSGYEIAWDTTAKRFYPKKRR